jgi:hypothetical protein
MQRNMASPLLIAILVLCACVNAALYIWLATRIWPPHGVSGDNGTTFQHNSSVTITNASYADMAVPESFHPSVAVCMWYNDGIRDYGDMAKALNQRFCDKHGYTLIVDQTDRFSTDLKTHLSQFEKYAWQRFSLMREVMHGPTHFDYVMWIDADAAFQPDHEVNKLRQILYMNKEEDVIFSADHPLDPLLNNGVMVFKNNAYSQALMQYYDLTLSTVPNACYAHGKPFGYHDQGCVRHSYVDNVMGLQQHAAIVPFGQLQTFYNTDQHYDHAAIMHMAGESSQRRVEVFTEMMTSIT